MATATPLQDEEQKNELQAIELLLFNVKETVRITHKKLNIGDTVGKDS